MISSKVIWRPINPKKSDEKQFKNEIKSLQKELNRKNKALAETAALLVLPKNSQCYLGKQRGQLIMKQERDKIIGLMDEARSNGARKKQACAIIGITPKTLQRWSQAEKKVMGVYPLNIALSIN